MEQKSHTTARVLAVLILPGAMAPASAHAWPIGKLFHLHPSADQNRDAAINVQFYNAGRMFQDVLVEGKIYTVKPHEYLRVTAPSGTPVFAASSTLGYRRGDLMFAINPKMNDKTIAFQ